MVGPALMSSVTSTSGPCVAFAPHARGMRAPVSASASQGGTPRGHTQAAASGKRAVAATGAVPAAGAASAAGAATQEQWVRLGASDVEVPPLGVGAWAWGDKFFWNDGEWGPEKEAGARAAFRASLDMGLGFVDTAEVYGTKQFGAEDSETLLGRFIAEEGPARCVTATKFAALPWRAGRGAVVSALKASLQRLKMDRVDLYQIHWPGVWGNDGYVEGLADCVEQGLARAVGVSNFKEDRLRRAHKQLAARGVPLASNQVHYNILYRVPEENGVKAACEELGVTLIAYSPLAQGMLSGKYSVENPPTGPRGVSYSAEYLTKMQPLLGRMRELGEKYGGKSPVQVALNWLVAQGNVVPIPGGKSPQQVEEFAGALGWRLSPEEVEELRALGKSVPLIQGFPAERF